MKKMKQDTKDLLMVVVYAIPVLFLIVSMFYITQPATEANTYVANENIIDVKFEPTGKGGGQILYIITANKRYMLDTGWNGANEDYELAENILSSNQQFSITVWKKFNPHISVIFGPEIWTYQIVGLRDHTNVYWDIDHHNKYQKSERIAAVIASVLLLLAYAWLFIWMCPRSGTKKKKGKSKKKRKKTRMTKEIK